MPLYLIKLYRSGNPWQQVSRPYEAPDLNFARAKAREQLTYARGFTATGRTYDSYAVSIRNPRGGLPIVVASGIADQL